tara:strand:- start:1782 stop:2156 length:375 start_codon:yes stop_codon:yes gene_type:complete
MTEKEAIMVFEALGAFETTSRTQKKNGTSEWELKTGEVVTEHSNGYVRKKMFDKYGRVEGCYQLNQVKRYGNEWTDTSSGKVYQYYDYRRIMLPTRVERLERLIKYAARKVNIQWEKIKNFENL